MTLTTEMQTQITPRCVIEEETEELSKKNHFAALQAEIYPLDN